MALVMAGNTVVAQNAADALRYSENFYPVNARSMGVANAFGALGANPLSPSINPAGLGLYRKSEFSFSPAINIINTKSQYLNNNESSLKANFNLGNLSLVINDIKTQQGEPKTKGWVGNTFSINISRQKGFHLRSNISGLNETSSILESFADRAEGTYPTEFTQNSIAGLAFKNWLINPYLPTEDNNLDSNQYYTSTEKGKTPTADQEQNLSASGGLTDLQMAFGSNYSDKLYLGVTVGIPFIEYEQERTFSEANTEFDQADLNDSLANYKTMSFTEQFSTSGNGIYGGVGFIFRPVDFLRFGASIYSPTFYSLKDEYTYEMQATVQDIDSNSSKWEDNLKSEDLSFEYDITTPFRVHGSFALILAKKGFFSFDYEYKNFGNAQIDSDDFGFSETNERIGNIYRGRHKFKFGGEFNVDVFSIRGGFAHFTSPYVDGATPEDYDGSGQLYSLGLGINNGAMSYDFAYQLNTRTQFERPYELNSANKPDPEAFREINQHQLIFTFNYKW